MWVAWCWAGAAAVLTALFAWGLRPVAKKLHLVDAPTEARKIHKFPVPLVGGVALAGGVGITLWAMNKFTPGVIVDLPGRVWWLILAAVAVILFVGILDDRWRITPASQLLGPIGAALLIIIAGITVRFVTNPLGGIVEIGAYWWLSALITFLWLVGMMEGVKLLDGLDGLATGLSVIGAVMIFGLTMTGAFWQPTVGAVALILAGAGLGFLLFNFHPARVFLGEGGAVFLGFALGLLAILSGSKIATTLLVMGVPVFDVVRVAVVRWRRGRSPLVADQSHLHHLLLRTFHSQRWAVLVYWLIGLFFGALALVLPSVGKVVALIVMAIFTWLLAALLERRLLQKKIL